MKAIFLYVGHYGASRADSLVYLGILPDGGNPLDLIRARYDLTPDNSEWGKGRLRLLDKTDGSELAMFGPKEDGETSYVILDLDKPGAFLSSFEFEGDDGVMADKVRLKPEDLS
jgi:hypothetical protein